MISPNNEAEGQKPPVPNFQDLLDQAIAEGVIGGIVGFMTKNNVNLKPGDKSKEPLKQFTSQFLAEYVGDAYPFNDSFKDFVIEYIASEVDVLKAVYDNHEYQNFIKLAHVIGGGAAATFLEGHRIEVLKLISDIRG